MLVENLCDRTGRVLLLGCDRPIHQRQKTPVKATEVIRRSLNVNEIPIPKSKNFS
ncbi:MAG: hypothetical protein KME22_16260 [Hassallia sp. WJT32-NPBG1]|nr:hypothetical protein [Hassallia sp. WJT32-NPBG1]